MVNKNNLNGWQMTFLEFNKTFEHNVKIFSSKVGAYEETEDAHFAICGERRYSDYDSFRMVRKRKLNNEKNNKK